jgi:hypothetical protein
VIPDFYAPDDDQVVYTKVPHTYRRATGGQVAS